MRMESRFAYLRADATRLRKKGHSIRDIELALGIPRSTLSGWLRSVQVAETHKKALKRRWDEALVKARKEAVHWHNAQKDRRLKEAAEAASTTLMKIGSDPSALELALAILYLGEGGKTKDTLTLGSSDPLIISFYISALELLYGIPRYTLRAELHLRADQDEQSSKIFWSEATGIPINRFVYTTRDGRTRGRPTYSNYHGVCAVSGGGVAIQRKLMYLARSFAEQTANNRRD